ncbi:hypothetical protein HETIRDRAFT_311013 [Heterobasidion irregulare TC 32-1]|uniref:Uncharacterized protein n=1 Tax=Heterobasidion irregulare (strain TC 32-1) TaxID=747525 RepID=W4KLM8_HETIT|nr:uncharacterized protein HETIRDRAFT_311013 [Heterobasidion irregulare TC 32-1]ETW85951.1 hypothetical protein HETIRDRAFT_311013 [Heterobasidion irregulare TC 32-1]
MPRYQQPERTPPAYPFPPGSWGVRGTDNLRQYLSEAALPTMILGPTAPQIPPSGHKSHMNLLSTRLERGRHLTSMFSFDAGDLASSVRKSLSRALISCILKVTNAQVPDQTLAVEDEDPYTMERLSVPCQGFDIPRATLLAPDNLDRFVSWCDHLPLQTIQRVLHLVYPSSKSWRISPEGGDVDDSILRCFTWTRPPPKTGTDGDPGQTSAIIVVQPPWILAEQDLKSFGKCQSFPNYKEDWVRPMKSSERLWGKVYDVCVARDCPWFVLTNYSGWVFGVFSKGWTRGFATPVQAFNSSDSGILEYLFYWFSSSMGLPGSFVIPEVGDEHVGSSQERPCLVYDVMKKIPDAALALYSLT